MFMFAEVHILLLMLLGYGVQGEAMHSAYLPTYLPTYLSSLPAKLPHHITTTRDLVVAFGGTVARQNVYLQLTI